MDASIPEGGQSPTESRSLLHNRDFMVLWSGQLISTLGTSASQVVFPLLILALTNSPAAAGIAAALESIPYIVFSLPVGALVDRWDRKRVMILCDTGRALTLASIPVAMALNRLSLTQIYVASLVEGTLFVFFNLSETAAMTRVVPTKQLPEAAAQNEVGYSSAAIIGPSIGTFLYQAVSHAAPFIADAVSYGASVISLFFIKTRFQAEVRSETQNLRAEIVQGLTWLWGKPLIRFMAMLTGGLNLVDSATVLIIIVLAKQMGAQDAQIGLIFSLAGVGAILGAVIGGRIQKRFHFGPVIISSVWSQVLLFPLLILVPRFYMLGVVMALIYFAVPIYNVTQFSYRLALIPDAMQGRVNSTFRLIALGTRPLGAALAGILLEKVGAVPTVILFAGWYVLIALATSANVHVRTAPPISQVSTE